jgi:hypothetical protein
MKTALLTTFFSASAWAHDDHGLWGAHWHASDAMGFLLVVVGLAVGFSRR